ncbi:MAG: alpha/beta fold hydrolase [Candidatus Binatia bacterium]
MAGLLHGCDCCHLTSRICSRQGASDLVVCETCCYEHHVWLLRIFVAVIAGLGAASTAFVQLAPETATRAIVAAERHRAGLVRREVLLPGGLRYVYLDGGRGEPLVLFHGFGADKDNFTRVARFLTPHFRVIVPDHIGFGESSHPIEVDYTASAQATRLHAFVSALDLGRIHLGGSSMGGQIALMYAAAYPTDVRSLWLLSPGGAGSAPSSELVRIIEENGRNSLMARDEREFGEVFEFAMSDPPWVPRAILDVMARDRMRNFALEEKIFEQVRGDFVEERVRGLATPSLIVWGREDRAIHVGAAEVLHALMPRSRVIIMDGIGHLPMIEAPEDSANDYLRFRASLS